MDPQIILLSSPPVRSRLAPVINPPVFSGGNIMPWLRAGYYTGNKPSGGLWTSTHTPEDAYACDWARGLATNEAIRAAMPPAVVRALRPYPLTPVDGARVRRIETLDDAQAFTAQYHLGTVPIPVTMLEGRGALLTTELTDWERACRECGAIHLTESGADAVAYAQYHGQSTSFAAWHCESTLWSEWSFVENGS